MIEVTELRKEQQGFYTAIPCEESYPDNEES